MHLKNDYQISIEISFTTIYTEKGYENKTKTCLTIADLDGIVVEGVFVGWEADVCALCCLFLALFVTCPVRVTRLVPYRSGLVKPTQHIPGLCLHVG